MNRELLLDNGGITWYAYTVDENGEIQWHEFEADGLEEAKKVCKKNEWMLDDDYWLPEVISW